MYDNFFFQFVWIIVVQCKRAQPIVNPLVLIHAEKLSCLNKKILINKLEALIKVQQHLIKFDKKCHPQYLFFLRGLWTGFSRPRSFRQHISVFQRTNSNDKIYRLKNTVPASSRRKKLVQVGVYSTCTFVSIEKTLPHK